MTSICTRLSGILLLICLAACTPGSAPDAYGTRPAQSSDLLATWNDRIEIHGDDYASWLSWRGLEPEPQHLSEFAITQVLAQLGQENDPDPRLEQQVRQRVLGEALLARIDATAEVDESRLESALAAAMEDDPPSRRYQLRNLFLALPQDSDEQTATRAQIEALRRRALAGEDFAALATEYSQSQTRFREGRLGLLPLTRLPAAVAEAVEPLEAGDISSIVEVGGGLSIFYCERIVEAAAPNPAELERRIRMQLHHAAIAEARAALDRELLAEHDLTPGTPQAARQLRELRAQRALEIGLNDSADIAREIRWQLMHARAGREMNRQIESRRGATDEGILREAFARMQSRGEGMVRFRVGGIALGPSSAERLDEARRLLARIEEGELSFEEAARRWSVDPSGRSGGDLGWFNVSTLAARDWMMMRAIRSIEPGELSGLIHSDDGLWIYRLLARQSGDQVRFEDVRSELEQRLGDHLTRALRRAIRTEISRELELADTAAAAHL
ncbi:peptidylprolyl isomerase [Wenzhouxiangella marina]|uniref:peptidylprolyl isomerase n=1 Tax=Wenzhouxiangella marina TaxID=1579979 RepID=A0A0K0XV79_9GAMM|nr:peptidylprolyl isomerase [Wenzhouxiangella marina]AKS41526.1 hypothetical protein WM2015_1152 [Wenzhouxiangella marina]MBB6086715.1 peptidyl-prolyl cis-trans isomerase SurA [Wenzhouxiangella marina]